MWFTAFVANSYAATTVNQERPCADDLLVQVEIVCGTAIVRGSDRATVKITGSVDDADALAVTSTPGRVSVVVKGTRIGKAPCADLVIDVPMAASVHAETVSASLALIGLVRSVHGETVSGALKIEGAPTSVKASSVSGSIEIGAPSRQVDAETVSGAIRMHGVGGVVTAESVSGAIDIVGAEAFDRLEIETMSGSITARGMPGPRGLWRLESFSGRVTAVIPGTSDAVVSWETLSGGVDALGDRKKEGARTLGAGNAKVSLETFSGSLRITTEG